MKGSDLLVTALENEGVDRICGVPGEENLDVVESLRQFRAVDWSNGMRYFLALSLLITLSVSVDAATVSGSKPAYFRARQHVVVRPSQGTADPRRFAVPGWTDEVTRRWLDDLMVGWIGLSAQRSHPRSLPQPRSPTNR